MAENENLFDTPEAPQKVDDFTATSNSVTFRQGMEDGDMQIKLKVKQKVKFAPLLKGDLNKALGNSSVNLEFDRTYENDNVEIIVKVNGNVNALFNSPTGSKKFGASFSATKYF